MSMARPMHKILNRKSLIDCHQAKLFNIIYLGIACTVNTPGFSKELYTTCKIDLTKTRLYNVDPLKPHFYIVKLGFTGVYVILLISAQKHRLWVLVRTASPRRFKRVPTIYVLSRNMKKYQNFYLKIYFFFW